MTRRVVLGGIGSGKFGLKVSRPGYDALSGATVGKKIAFDSTWTRALRVLRRGRVEAEETGTGSGGPKYVNVNFAAQASRPVVFVLMQTGSSSRWQYAQPVGGSVPFYGDGGGYVIVEDDRIRLLRPNFGTYVYSYIILRRL